MGSQIEKNAYVYQNQSVIVAYNGNGSPVLRCYGYKSGSEFGHRRSANCPSVGTAPGRNSPPTFCSRNTLSHTVRDIFLPFAVHGLPTDAAVPLAGLRKLGLQRVTAGPRVQQTLRKRHLKTSVEKIASGRWCRRVWLFCFSFLGNERFKAGSGLRPTLGVF